jgi:hypothetical protein
MRGQSFFSVRTLDDWNSAPEDIKMARNVGHLKEAVQESPREMDETETQEKRDAAVRRSPSVSVMGLGLDGLLKT